MATTFHIGEKVNLRPYLRDIAEDPDKYLDGKVCAVAVLGDNVKVRVRFSGVGYGEYLDYELEKA